MDGNISRGWIGMGAGSDDLVVWMEDGGGEL